MKKIIVSSFAILLMSYANVGTTDNSNRDTFYVSTEGENKADGSIEHPWRDIQASIDKLSDGDKLIIKSGIYYEKILFLGDDDSYISLKGERGAIIDGTGLKPTKTKEGLVFIHDAHHIEIDGLEIRNFTTDEGFEMVNTPIGVLIDGSSHDINITKNNIHHIENLSSCGESDECGTGANGIAVYGDTPFPMSNLLFSNNEVHHCILSSSEAFTINGNIDGFKIIENYVHDNNNIGIDVIGYEEDVCSECDEEQNRARNGIIKNNRAINNSTNLALGAFENNPWYEGEDGSAGGFYVDGGHHIIFDGNYASQNDLGFEFASEHAGKSSHDILMVNNSIYNNREVGLTMGGYAQNPSSQGGGDAKNIMVYNNSFYKNSGWGSEISFSYRVKDTKIANNIFYGEGEVAKNFSQEDNGQYQNITWGKNLWWGVSRKDLSDIKGEYIVQNPLFHSAEDGNLSLEFSSPAINQAQPQEDIVGWDSPFWQREFPSGIISSYGDREIFDSLDIGAREFGEASSLKCSLRGCRVCDRFKPRYSQIFQQINICF